MDNREYDYYLALDKCRIGRVRVNISSLVINDLSRKDNRTKKKRASKSRSRHDPQSRISADIDPHDLDHVLQVSLLSKEDLQNSLLPGAIHPRINTSNITIRCFNGRQRFKFAEKFYKEDDCWWEIELYCFDPSHPLLSLFLKRQSEQFNFSKVASDGEIYQKVKFYNLLHDEDSMDDWITELSENKQKLLLRLLDQKLLTDAFDTLIPFQGLWNDDDFNIGNIHRQLAIHSNAQLSFYITNRIYNTWNKITLGDKDIQDTLDNATVQNLHLKAPSASVLDRNYIKQQMDSPSDRSELFPRVNETHKRLLIRNALLDLKVIIPTIKTFQANCLYFGIITNIMKSILLDEDKPESVYDSMFSRWEIPDTFEEEVKEDEFRTVTLERPQLAFKFCFLQVVLAVMRHFPNLGDDGPKKERKRKRDSNPPVIPRLRMVYQTKVLRLAHAVGFRTTKIRNGLMNDEHLPLEVLEDLSEDTHGETITARCGRPWNATYMQVRTQLFLTNILQIGTLSGPNPSALYVQRDFILAFFDLTELINLGFQTPRTPVSRNFEAVGESNLQDERSILATPDETSRAVVNISDDDSPLSTACNLGGSEEDAIAQLEDDSSSQVGSDVMASPPSGSSSIQNRRRVPPREIFGNAQLSSTAALTVHPAFSRPRSVIPQVSFVMGEHNGMLYRRVEIPANEIERYLEQRHSWTGMVIQNGVLQTMRHEHIAKHMMHNTSDQKSFIMVKTSYIR
ncbi:hypothetical protein N431DRAFT_456576 [Stipitochalara longipes BDJ]|nr:hypothetical protein N431DRAFT_456576 [Stipitochalara longipes BDJ]